jgi:hypothetical protein
VLLLRSWGDLNDIWVIINPLQIALETFPEIKVLHISGVVLMGYIKLECTPEEAQRWYEHREAAKKCGRGGTPKISHKIKLKAVEMYRGGSSKRHILKELGMSINTLNPILAEMGAC